MDWTNEKECLAAVKEHGSALEFVNNQTPEICLAAVKQNGSALCDIIEALDDYETAQRDFGRDLASGEYFRGTMQVREEKSQELQTIKDELINLIRQAVGDSTQ